MSVKNYLTHVPQREDGGRTALDRFDYQTAWGVSRLLDLHEKGENYAVAFEFHDDIVALNDADEPTSAIFYQIKTKASGHWSFAQITSRRSAKKSSFAGKMYDNCVRFGAIVEKLAFVSNQPLPEVIVAHGEASFSSADKAKLESFVTAISAEVADYDDEAHTVLFFFMFSDLNLSNYENTVVGRIADFLEAELGTHVPPRTFALTLNDYCRRRSKSLADLENFETLKASKFVTRDNMLTWLGQARERHERRPQWSVIESQLSLTFPEMVKLERAWREYETLIRSRINTATISFTSDLSNLVHDVADQATSYEHLIDITLLEARKLTDGWYPEADDFFVKAAILYELKR